MNKTHIDFFSTGLHHKKTRLSVKMFSLDANHHALQSKQPRKTSISTFSFTRYDKKDRSDKQGLKNNDANKSGQYNTFYNTFTWLSSSATLSSKKKINKQQTQFSQLPTLFLNKINGSAQIQRNRIEIQDYLYLRIRNNKLQKLKDCTKITEQAENIQTDLNKSQQEKNIIQAGLQVIKAKKDQNKIPELKYELQRKKYFISNLQLQNCTKQGVIFPKNNSQHKFQMRKNVCLGLSPSPNKKKQSQEGKIVFYTQRKTINQRHRNQRFTTYKQHKIFQQKKENSKQEQGKRRLIKLSLNNRKIIQNKGKVQFEHLINRWQVAKEQNEDDYI